MKKIIDHSTGIIETYNTKEDLVNYLLNYSLFSGEKIVDFVSEIDFKDENLLTINEVFNEALKLNNEKVNYIGFSKVVREFCFMKSKPYEWTFNNFRLTKNHKGDHYIVRLLNNNNNEVLRMKYIKNSISELYLKKYLKSSLQIK